MIKYETEVSKNYNLKYAVFLVMLITISYEGSSQNTDSLFYSKETLTKVDKRPEFPGGIDSLVKFIQRNLICPKKAVKQRVEGSVFVSFVVNKFGRIDSVTVFKGISRECDLEALRLIRSFPKFYPGIIGGIYVNTKLSMAIKFKCYDEKRK